MLRSGRRKKPMLPAARQHWKRRHRLDL